MRLFIIILMLSGTTIFSYGQFERKAVEMSLSGTLGSNKVTMNNGGSSSEAQAYLFLASSVEYYIMDGISIGPQVGLLAVERDPPSQSVLVNISYTRCINDSKAALFIRGGAGKANSVSIPFYGGVLPARIDKEWIVDVYTGGAGVKFIISDAAALRLEANYRVEKFSRDNYIYLGYPSNLFQYRAQEISYNNTTLLMGFSVLL